MKNLSRALAFILALLPVSALAQSAPANLSYHSVYGRLGAVPGDTGPGSAIPFATLLSQMGAVPTNRNINTTAPLTGGGNLGSDLTLALTRSALTAVNDTNVTATLGGTPASALVAATSFTLGWSGQLSIARGGTGQATKQAGFEALAPTPTRAGDIMYWDGSHYVTLPGNNSGTQVLQENASGVPSWVTVSGTGTVTSVTCFGVAITSTGTCATAATKSDQQTGSSTTAVVTPSQQQQHDSAKKLWVSFVGTGACTPCSVLASYGITSVSKAGTGIYVIQFSTAFSSVNYACTVSAVAAVSLITAAGKTASQMSVTTTSAGGATLDSADVNVECSGRQ